MLTTTARPATRRWLATVESLRERAAEHRAHARDVHPLVAAAYVRRAKQLERAADLVVELRTGRTHAA